MGFEWFFESTFADGEWCGYILVCTINHIVINGEIGWMPEASSA